MRGGYSTAEMLAQRNRCRVAQLALYQPPFRDFVVRTVSHTKVYIIGGFEHTSNLPL